jgi:hypothetical protein
MVVRTLVRASNHRTAITLTLLGALLLNLLVVGYVQPPDLLAGDDLPMASRCQGGGVGCVEQPMIPPPLVGLPRAPAPAALAYGEPALVVGTAPSASEDPPPTAIEHPPEPLSA